jgi:hypothetical protein
MTVVRTRRSRLALTLRVLTWACATALLGSCGGSSISPPGTPVVTLGDTGGDFVAYRIAIDSITLTNTNGSVVTPLLTPESVDLVSLTDLTELLEVPAVPSGTYKSASITLDFTTAQVLVNVNGQAVAASLVGAGGAALSTSLVTVTFDPSNPLVITNGKSSRMAIDIDLAASNSINTTPATPVVTVRPFLVVTPAPVDSTVIRARGLLVTALAGTTNFDMNVRPLIDLVSALGAVTVHTSAQTYFNINGVAYTGAAGLAVLTTQPENTIIAAFGTLGDLSGITPGFNATSVYVGASLESPLADNITGVVSKRVGDVLTVHGATYVSRVGVADALDNVAVTIGSNTIVSEDGVNASGLTAQAVSIGQQVSVSGQAGVDSSNNITLDATAGQVRLGPTRLWGSLTSASPGSATLDVLSLGNFVPAALDFVGTGSAGHDANPALYAVSTGAINETTTAPGTLLQVDGLVSAFGAAPPDFTASAITAGSATEQRLVVEWVNGGATQPFSSLTAAGLEVNLGNADLGTIHEIRTGPASLALPPGLLITTVGADQSQLRLAVGNTTLTTGVSLFNSIGGFVTALTATFNGTAKIYRVVAVGQYNSASNRFVASRISVALQE